MAVEPSVEAKESSSERIENRKNQDEALYKKYEEQLVEIEQAVKFLSLVFETGTAQHNKYGKVTIEDPSMVARIAVSLYSTMSVVCGGVRARQARYEARKKMMDASYYKAVKEQYANAGIKCTQKDLESEVTGLNKDSFAKALNWEMLGNRCYACKDALGEQLKTLNMLQQMRATELRNWN